MANNVVTLAHLAARCYAHAVIEAGKAEAPAFCKPEYDAWATKTQEGLMSTKSVQAAVAEHESVGAAISGLQAIRDKNGKALEGSAKWSDAKRFLEAAKAKTLAEARKAQSKAEIEEYNAGNGNAT